MRKVLVLTFMTLDGVAEFPDYDEDASRHDYRAVGQHARSKCSNCRFAAFVGPYGECRLFEKEGLDRNIEVGHVCDEWEAKR